MDRGTARLRLRCKKYKQTYIRIADVVENIKTGEDDVVLRSNTCGICNGDFVIIAVYGIMYN